MKKIKARKKVLGIQDNHDELFLDRFKMMNIILCTGMMRSASTWSFNVCRLLGILLSNYLKIPFFSGYRDYTILDDLLKEKVQSGQGIIVVKVHTPAHLALSLIQHKIAKNVCTIRDPRDCVASRRLFEEESFEESVGFIKANLSFVSFYRQKNHTQFIRYEDMIENPSEQIKIISDYVGIGIDEKLISEIDRQTNMRNAKFISDSLKSRSPETLIRDRSHLVDPTTFIHENHIHGGTSGRWKNELTKEQIKFVHVAFKPWLIELGYETEDSFNKIFSSL